jgi:hypothetical protein
MSSVLRKVRGDAPKSLASRASCAATWASNSSREYRKLSEWWLVSATNSTAPVSASSLNRSIRSGAHSSNCSSAVEVIA